MGSTSPMAFNAPMDRAVLEHRARRLQWVTIAWNMFEVFVTIGLGLAASSLALIAFGLDSLVEVFAGLVVVWHLASTEGTRSERDRRALRLVAAAFAVLGVYLIVASVRSLVLQQSSDPSPIGIAYLAATALVMFVIARRKRVIGRRLESPPYQAEASMTLLDGCLATGVLVALALSWLAGWWWADPLAAGVVGLFALREAREGWREAG
jgi:divalent metal cation (Fe/Co/Zn/Cd) transporter